MRMYEVTLLHDNGVVRIRTRARTYQAAIRIVCHAEHAPESAVQAWRVVPTKKQIEKAGRDLAAI